MKKALFTVIMAVFFICANAQNNDSTKVNYQYCEIIGNKPYMSSKIKISIDFGIDGELVSVDFRSMVETLNAMEKKGWCFVEAYTAPVNNGNNMFYHWLLKKEIK